MPHRLASGVKSGVTSARRLASAFLILYQQLRQYLYFSTSQPGVTLGRHLPLLSTRAVAVGVLCPLCHAGGWELVSCLAPRALRALTALAEKPLSPLSPPQGTCALLALSLLLFACK